MPPALTVHSVVHLPPDRRAAVLDLIATAAAAHGPPLGEHKQSQLERGGDGFTALLAYDAGDRLAGYAHLRWSPGGAEPRAAVELATHPDADARAVGHRLLEGAEAQVAGSGGGLLWAWCHRVVDPADTLPATRGYRVQRRLVFLRRDIAERPEPPEPPPGVALRPYAGPADDAEFLRVNNAAFEGHPENGGWTPEVFEARRRLAWFDPQDLLLADRGDRLAGFHWTKRHHDPEPHGEVYVLAVDPAEQGTGLGRYLLGAGLAHLHDRGCREVVLYVDRAQPVALRLYHAAGFGDVHDEVCFERHVDPA